MTRTSKQGKLWIGLVEDAQAEVDRVFRALPAPLRETAARVPVSFQRVPGGALVKDGVEADTMGLFVGSPFASEMHDEMPPQIIMFLANIWDDAECEPKEYRFQVRQTLLHELGHYLGLCEDDLALRDLQ